MAIQNIDRQKAKHAINTTKRKTPKLVNRTNKTILGEVSAFHTAKRFWGYYKVFWRQCDY